VTAAPRASVPKDRAEAPPAAATRAFSGKDLGLLVGLPFSFLLSWLTPQALWPAIGRGFSPVAATMLAARDDSVARRVAALAGSRDLPQSPDQIARQLIADHIEENLQLLRIYRPGGWHPELRVAGKEHVDGALARGHGAVIWLGHFAFTSLLSKMALADAGIAASHLSHPRHGFSDSRFGMRVLNPIRRGAEDRFLAERVMMAADQPVTAMRVLQKRLRENRVVSVMVRERAMRPVALPFLDGEIRLATGAPDIAYATRAALLPAFLIRVGPGRFTLTIEPPQELPDRIPRHEATSEMLPRYVALLESYVLRFPGLWRGWTV